MSNQKVPDIVLICTICDFEGHAEDIPLEEKTESQAVYNCPDCGETKFREKGCEPMKMPDPIPEVERRRQRDLMLGNMEGGR